MGQFGQSRSTFSVGHSGDCSQIDYKVKAGVGAENSWCVRTV